MTESFSKEDLQRRIRWYIGLRFFLVIALGTAGIIPQFIQERLSSSVRQNISIVIITLSINGLFLGINSLKSQRYGLYKALAISQLIFDVILYTAVVNSNGGIESIIIMLLVIPIIMSGALLGRKAIYLTGLATSASYDLLVFLNYKHVVMPEGVLAPELHNNLNYLILTLIFAPAMLLTITVIIDYVSKLIRERTVLSTKLQVVSAERAEIEAVIKSMGSALVAVDRAGKITTINDAFERLTGWGRHDVIGVDLDKILPLLDEHGKRVEQAQRPLLQLLNTTLQTGVPAVQHISRYYYAKKGGAIFPFVGSIAPIALSGRIIGAAAVFEDASSIKQINQLKTNFIALASHQLKTPISEIQGYAENMLQGLTGAINEHQSKYLLAITEITERCNKLIADLLDSSVLEQGAIRLDIEAVRLSEVIDKVAEIYQARIKQKSIVIKVVQPDHNIEVQADKDELVEILGNVMANAVSYTKRGTTITIETKKESGYGLILVTDEGGGMEKKVIENLFLKDDVLSSAPEAEGGTGIGLYLAKQLLALQKGEISVLSSTNAGTTMVIKIPLGGKAHDGSSSSN